MRRIAPEGLFDQLETFTHGLSSVLAIAGRQQNRDAWVTLQRLLLRLIATIVVALATLAGCSNRDCAYYGGADANTRCVVVGPAPIGAGP